ncbi:MAG: rod shape-determining protein MreD [Lentisphaerae bacterium]|nr:rod shape-determining protein MreD [Lentisphaerota bacterium]
MSVLSLVIVLLSGGVLQAVLPTWAAAGQMPVPVLPALVVYYALTRNRVAAFWIGVAAGLVQDALGIVPLGFSSCCFAVAALLLNRYREEVFEWEGLTHMILGGAAAAGTTLALGLLLGAAAGMHLPVGRIALKTLGAAGLGVATTPLVCRGVRRLDVMLGLVAEARR